MCSTASRGILCWERTLWVLFFAFCLAAIWRLLRNKNLTSKSNPQTGSGKSGVDGCLGPCLKKQYSGKPMDGPRHPSPGCEMLLRYGYIAWPLHAVRGIEAEEEGERSRPSRCCTISPQTLSLTSLSILDTAERYGRAVSEVLARLPRGWNLIY